jgi:hypothetical protein
VSIRRLPERFLGMNPNPTETLVRQYFQLWSTKQLDRAYALVADDVTCTTPMNTYSSAAQLRPALERFLEGMQSVELLDVMTDGPRATLHYACKMPFGTLRTAELARVEGGKIRSIELVYDATELRKLIPARR